MAPFLEATCEAPVQRLVLKLQQGLFAIPEEMFEAKLFDAVFGFEGAGAIGCAEGFVNADGFGPFLSGLKDACGCESGFVEPEEFGGGLSGRFEDIVVGGDGSIEVACFLEGGADAGQGLVAPSGVGGVLGCDLFPDFDGGAVVGGVLVTEGGEVFALLDDRGGLGVGRGI